MKIAVVPGSFDPVTNGHLDIIARAAALFDRVIVAVCESHAKRHMFGADKRLELAAEACGALANVECRACGGLVADFAKEAGATAIVKGIRSGSDADYEVNMAHITREIAGIETVLLPAGQSLSHISSSFVRELAARGKDISAYVPRCVADAMGNAQLGLLIVPLTIF